MIIAELGHLVRGRLTRWDMYSISPLIPIFNDFSRHGSIKSLCGGGLVPELEMKHLLV